MNELITTIFADFQINANIIPVKWLFYEGHGEPYVVWQQVDANNSYSGDDGLLGYVDYFDFDVYAKGNYLAIIEGVKEILRLNGFVWQPSRSSEDMYEVDTGYYHKTLCFARLRQVGEEDEAITSITDEEIDEMMEEE